MIHRRGTRETLYGLSGRDAHETADHDPELFVGLEWLGALDRSQAGPEDRHTLADAALQAALHFSAAPRGNIQFADAAGVLHIEAQYGFEQPFLEFFESVCEGQAACGAAAGSRAVVIVEDVATSPLFANLPSRDVMLAAHALAVVSFPIIRRTNDVAGVLSVHYDAPGLPSRHALGMLGSIAERLGRLL